MELGRKGTWANAVFQCLAAIVFDKDASCSIPSVTNVLVCCIIGFVRKIIFE